MQITMLNGEILECLPGTEFHDCCNSIPMEELNLILKEFKESVWLLLNHAERIMTDSRMFLAPVYSQTFSPFFSGARPRIGTFLEWWLHYPQYSRDCNGDPIFCISGNPMTGSHSCYAIDPAGQTRKATEKSLLPILKSFGHVNSLYPEVKLKCKHYEMKEVIKILNESSNLK